MNNISKSLLFIILILSLFSCGDGKIEESGLMKELQAQVDEVIKQGYQINRIDISSKSFSNHGQGDVGEFDLMFIRAVSPDPKIEYLANYSYADDFKELKFLGYPVSISNKSEGKGNNFTPDLPNAISKLGEIKKQIPEGYKYDNLLHIQYKVEDNQPVYKFKIELKPDNDEITHPKVTKEEKSHVTVTRSTNRKKFGTTKTTSKTNVDKKKQHTINFKLTGDQIEIE